jgi:hypothetical protein
VVGGGTCPGPPFATIRCCDHLTAPVIWLHGCRGLDPGFLFHEVCGPSAAVICNFATAPIDVPSPVDFCVEQHVVIVRFRRERAGRNIFFVHAFQLLCVERMLFAARKRITVGLAGLYPFFRSFWPRDPLLFIDEASPNSVVRCINDLYHEIRHDGRIHASGHSGRTGEELAAIRLIRRCVVGAGAQNTGRMSSSRRTARSVPPAHA